MWTASLCTVNVCKCPTFNKLCRHECDICSLRFMSPEAAQSCYNYHIEMVMPSADSQPGFSGGNGGPLPLEESFTLCSLEEGDAPADGDDAPLSQDQQRQPKTPGEYISYVHIFYSL